MPMLYKNAYIWNLESMHIYGINNDPIWKATKETQI